MLGKVGNYSKFLWSQMKGWTFQSYALMFFAFGVQIGLFVVAPEGWSFVSMLATCISVACVLAISNARSINGLFGLVSAILLSVVGFHSHNYATIAMQMSYVMFLDIPVLVDPKWNVDLEKHIRRFKPATWVMAILLNAGMALLSWFLLTYFTNDPRPITDAISFAIGFTGSILCYLRYSEQYIWWIAGGIFSVVLWAITAAQGDSNLALFMNYFIFLMNDLLGLGWLGVKSPWWDKKHNKKAETVSSSDVETVGGDTMTINGDNNVQQKGSVNVNTTINSDDVAKQLADQQRALDQANQAAAQASQSTTSTINNTLL